MSPTHLNSFLDTEHAGPEHFYFTTLLRFPQAPTPSGQFGNTIHETLEWVQHRFNENGVLPPVDRIHEYFRARLERKKLSARDLFLLKERGEEALQIYMSQHKAMFAQTDIAEHNFRGEGVFVGEVRLGGKVDRMEIDKQARTITVVDYKTGRGYAKWESNSKLHKYRQQLYCYKLLIEGSHTFQGYTVTAGRLEFVEPDEQGRTKALELQFDSGELERTKQLLAAVWHRIHALDFPDISQYSKDLKGMLAFEADLLQ